jgi:hypothetical protein
MAASGGPGCRPSLRAGPRETSDLASSLRLALGGLDLAITAEEAILPPDDESYREFVSTSAGVPGPEAVRVRLVLTPAPSGNGRTIFESDATWSVLADGRTRVILDRPRPGPALAVHLEPGSTEVLAECGPGWVVPGPPRAIRSPVRYPFDQLLAMYLLGRQGLLVHAAGFLVRGRAVVLPGVSGAGKTTFARLAGGRAGWEPLSDDRIIVRLPEHGEGAFAHGTPWPGEGRVAANRGGPFGWLVFLSQGTTNEVRRLAPAEAAPRLLAAASIPWYDADYLDEALEACDRLLARVPAALLTFRPEPEAVGLVERVMGDGCAPA